MAAELQIIWFLTSKCWCTRFLQQKNLSLRQKMITQKLLEDLDQKITNLHGFMIKSSRKENYQLVYNFFNQKWWKIQFLTLKVEVDLYMSKYGIPYNSIHMKDHIFDSSVGRALHRYRRGHGFVSFRPEWSIINSYSIHIIIIMIIFFLGLSYTVSHDCAVAADHIQNNDVFLFWRSLGRTILKNNFTPENTQKKMFTFTGLPKLDFVEKFKWPFSSHNFSKTWSFIQRREMIGNK